jgi:hypothetical protein
MNGIYHSYASTLPADMVDGISKGKGRKGERTKATKHRALANNGNCGRTDRYKDAVWCALASALGLWSGGYDARRAHTEGGGAAHLDEHAGVGV